MREFLHLKLFSRVSHENCKGLLSTWHFAGLVCVDVGVGAQRAKEGIWDGDGWNYTDWQ